MSDELKLIWSPRALEELDEIVAYIDARNRDAAERMRDRIDAAAERLPLFPYIHRPGRVVGTREAVVHPNYILVYRIADGSITVQTVVHARRQYP